MWISAMYTTHKVFLVLTNVRYSKLCSSVMLVTFTAASTSVRTAYTSDSQTGVYVPPGVRTRPFRGTRKKLNNGGKGNSWAIYLQLQQIVLK
jgi:hypothetical protein